MTPQLGQKCRMPLASAARPNLVPLNADLKCLYRSEDASVAQRASQSQGVVTSSIAAAIVFMTTSSSSSEIDSGGMT
jgi:hypothetical protein